MRVATLEPEYFPPAQYFVPFLGADEIHLRTGARYRRQTLHNRTRLRNADGWQWITVPVGHGQFGRTLSHICVQGDPGWRTRHAKALRYNYESAPFYMYYAPRFHSFWAREWDFLVDATVASVSLLAELLGMDCEVVAEGSESPADALPTADPVTYKGLDVPYAQNFQGFLPGMSAIDLLMNHGPQARAVIEQYPGP
ncbi:MAG: hypothetical protein COV99_08260 [Bacteroidetes bacterium CG12_big_fil_rev_8_21_14_0_65_60_17]|nr:MAG: hypothetical protein COV99_08260 [Bacteroidetes bacterium CG12_big_fil_rev_8_21_14_0_65_60_17]